MLVVGRGSIGLYVCDIGALDLAASGEVAPEKVVSNVLDWDDLPTALPEKHLKPVFVRTVD